MSTKSLNLNMKPAMAMVWDHSVVAIVAVVIVAVTAVIRVVAVIVAVVGSNCVEGPIPNSSVLALVISPASQNHAVPAVGTIFTWPRFDSGLAEIVIRN